MASTWAVLVAALVLVPTAGAIVRTTSTVAASCPCTLVANDKSPELGGVSTANGRPGGPWTLELGVKFFVDTPVRLTAVRFYKDPLETGAHTATLWSASGIALATIPFTSETGSGWQQQSLATPLSLGPGVVYVVSIGYNAFWGRTLNGFVTQIDSGPLHSVADGQNGVFADAAGTFPTQSFLSSNYFVDLEVSADAPPTVTGSSPAPGASGVAAGSTVAATFSRAMDAATFTAASFTLTDQDGAPVPASVGYDPATSTATLTPSSPLLASTTYTPRLSTAVRAADGQPLAVPVAWSFTTVAGSTVRINSGDAAYTTADGLTYANDAFFTGGSTSTTIATITRTKDSSLYQNERWGQFDYAIPVTNGRYDVKFHFVEIYYVTFVPGCEGKRIFGMDILDTPASPDIAGLDICSQVGPNAALDRTVQNVVVTDGVLNIKSVYGPTDDPELAAIEVFPAGTAGDTTPPSAPGTPSSTGGTTQASLGWAAATDNVGVTLYDVYRSATPGFIPTYSTRVGQTTATSFLDKPLPAGTYYYVVKAEDAAGNIGVPSIQSAATVVVADTTPPTAPAGLTATGGTTQAALTWTASTDDVGVQTYTVYRSATSGFTPSSATQIAKLAATTTTYKDKNLAAGTYYYVVVASDAGGNVSAPSNQASAAVVADTTPPTIAITAPAANATVSGFVMLTAKASDNVSVAGVQFKLDGANLGAEDTAAPWALDWDTSTSGGTHVLTAVARDPSGNTVTAATVTVTIANLITAQDTNLVAAYGFGEGAGTTVNDSSGNGNTGTVANATWATGHFDGGLAFNGTNAMVSVPDSASLDLTNGFTLEAWVNPAALGKTWRAVIVKEQPSNLTYALYAAGGSPRPTGDIVIGGALTETKGPADLPLGTWSFLTAAWDGTTLRLFVNGALVAEKPITGMMSVTAGALRIGGDSVWGEFFKGTIDDVRIYNRGLLGAEIQTDMNAPVR